MASSSMSAAHVPPPIDFSQAWSASKLNPLCRPKPHLVLAPNRIEAVSGRPFSILLQLRSCNDTADGGQTCVDESAKFYGKIDLFEGQEVYAWMHGPAILAGEVWVHNEEAGLIRIDFYVAEAGEYDLRLVQWPANKWVAKMGKFCIHPIAQDPGLTVVVSPPADHPSGHRFIPGWPLHRCNDLRPPKRPRRGRWLRCEDVVKHYPQHYTGCPRFGWIWLPYDCYYRFVPPAALLGRFPAQPAEDGVQRVPLWSVAFTSSLLRSLFWYAMDTLGGNGRINSVTWKCWGWMDLKVGALRWSWRDFRLIGFRAVPENYEGTYMVHFGQFLNELRTSKPRQPDLLLFETLKLEEELEVLTQSAGLDSAKDTTVLFTNVQVGRPDRSAFEGFRLRELVYEQLANATARHGRQFGYLDVFTMAYPMLHDLEAPLPGVAKHHHRQCGSHVCAVQMDMAATMYINAMLTILEERGADIERLLRVPHLHPGSSQQAQRQESSDAVRQHLGMFNSSAALWAPYSPTQPVAELCTLCPRRAFVLPFVFHPSASASTCDRLPLNPA